MDRPSWFVVGGGSRDYVERMTAPFKERIRQSSPVERVVRDPQGVEVTVRGLVGPPLLVVQGVTAQGHLDLVL